jgi:hypothetical protein
MHTEPSGLAILNCRVPKGTMQQHNLDKNNLEFSKLTRSTAKRLLRFWQVRQIAAN